MLISFMPRTLASEEEEKEETNDYTAQILSGTGLVAVGGAGSIIIYNNSKKKKDEPVKEIKQEEI